MNITLTAAGTPQFTSDIPPLSITGAQGKIEITIEHGQSQIYTTSIWLTREVTEFDIRSIIILHMESKSLPYAIYTVTAAHDTQTLQIQLTAIYSRGKSSLDATIFTQSRFLTLTDTKLLPQQAAFDTVSIHATQEGQATLELTYRTPAGETDTLTATYQYTAGYTRFDLDFQQIIDSITEDQELPAIEDITPVSALLSAGSRTMQYYFTPQHPAAAISYLNQFNSPEHIWIFGSWRRTGKITRKKATCASQAVPHSLEIDPQFEITTHHLDFRQAYIIPEIAISPYIWAFLFAEGSPLATAAFQATPVTSAARKNSLASASFKAIPTEAALDASPMDTEPQAYTIKVTAVQPEAALGFQFEIHRIFTEQFTNQFI